MMERLTNSIDYCQLHCDFGKSNECFFQDKSKCYEKNIYEKLREYEDLEEQGLLLRLPCKVGDTVYFALLGRIIEKQVFSIVSFSNSKRIYCGGTSEYFRPEDIGKTFFLTREEAEAALESI